MKNIPLLIGTIVGTVLLVIGVAVFFGRSQAPKIIDQVKLKAGSRHVLLPAQDFFGKDASASASAKVTAALVASDEAQASDSANKKIVTVVEFSDFQCPACKAASPLLKVLRTAHPGQIEFVFRAYPLVQIHQNALLAAQAAEAAGKFDLFWKYHDVLFEKQEQWADLSSDEAKERMIQYAIDLGIEKDSFTKELNSDTVISAVQSDINLGNEINVSATPTFFVNGQQVSVSDVEQVVAKMLEN